MIPSKLNLLRPLIESQRGQHLTAYIQNDNNIFDLKRQIREVLDTSYEYLAPVMSPDSLVKFLAPLHNLLEDNLMLKGLKKNVGIFRNEDSFRVLSLPVSVEKTCVVATSFHVKPLLRWMQVDQEFLLLGVDDSQAKLYLGNQVSLNSIDSLTFQPGLEKGQNVEWLNAWLSGIAKESTPPLFVAGKKELAAIFLNRIRYPKLRAKTIWPSFTDEAASDISEVIRVLIRKETRKIIEQALVEFYQAEELNLTNRNIFQIAKAAIKGRVKKLIIADGINIFGKIDKKSGGLAIHAAHLDHEDDDLLDDLAQIVLSKGGEVVVANRDEIPKGRPILAILQSSDQEVKKVNFQPNF